jgi:hypothetical protein
LAGWTQTCPGGGNYTISLTDKDAVNYSFGNYYGLSRYRLVEYGLEETVMHPIMPRSDWLVRSQEIKKLSEAEVAQAANFTKLSANISFPASFSLLSYIPYVPNERDQGHCGNCWVWGCTAPVEVANRIQNGISDRLSIQFVNSNYNGGSGSSWACCGGWENGFANFYTSQGKFIPWSNANANFRDGGQGCPGSTTTPASSISATPNYLITSIQWHLIPTRGSGITQDQAINNIKAVLNMNKAVTLGFYLPDFNPFWSFWGSSSGVWNPDLYCGLPDGQYPGGHEVTIVGYDGTNPSNRYWIALNSWGIDAAHPDGTYKIKMNMSYDCSNSGYYSYDFGYFDVTFGGNTPPNAPSAPSGPASGTPGSSYSYSATATDPNGDQVKYTFDWGDGTTTDTGLVNSDTRLSASHAWTEAGTYQVKAMATDSKGASSGWSAIQSVAIS